ncbi:MAG: glutaminase [Alphaproteobacteria bacterium]|nr:glutaminase [Alphaproteobacteria bacterium SS10]
MSAAINYQELLNRIEEAIQPLYGRGKVADYIPALAEVAPRQFGMALRTVDGEVASVGAAAHAFSAQSITKLFALQLAIVRGGDMVWTKVGKEPSGDPFNSLVLLEHEGGFPRNPFINAGALAMIDLLLSAGRSPDQLILSYLRMLSGNAEITIDEAVAQSEWEHANVNAALTHFMKGHGVIDHDVDTVLKAYCRMCAITMSCEDLAAATQALANRGFSSVTGETVLPARQARRINAVMLTCGTYDSVGSFAYRVGLPAKSGVGGGIVAVVPDKMTLAVWSPELDRSGNSYIGTAALEQFTTMSGLSVF